jgi:hypothetical protein
MSDAIIPQEFLSALDAYDQNAEDALKAFAESTAPPPVIYHYTDDSGLKEILRTGTLWFTDIFDLNDPSELRHGFSKAIDALNLKSAGGAPEEKRFASLFERFDIGAGIEEAGHFFVCCFSGTRDELGQWRAYADNGRGFALGFDTNVLEPAFTKNEGARNPNHSTFPIAYNDQRLTEIQTQLVEKMFHLISLPRKKHIHPAAINPYMSQLLVRHLVNATRAVIFFKHEAYKNEDEYRFLQLYPTDTPAPDVRYRTRPYSLVRYREFDWRRVAADSLKEIVVGPAAEKATASQFAKDCLEAFHSTEAIEIIPSEIPYRAP